MKMRAENAKIAFAWLVVCGTLLGTSWLQPSLFFRMVICVNVPHSHGFILKTYTKNQNYGTYFKTGLLLLTSVSKLKFLEKY